MRVFLFIAIVCVALFGESLKEAKALYDQKEYKSAYEIYLKLAKEGNVKAQFNLALMLDFGFGVNKDEKEAMKWYYKAANSHHGPSQYNLAKHYDLDSSTDASAATKAKIWYEKACENEMAKACTNLALLYYNGNKNFKKNNQKAIEFFTKGSEFGDETANINLGLIYGWGESDLQDKLKAYNYLKEAIKSGEPKAGEYMERLCTETKWVCEE
ncbi:MAG: sel1 repeat family protein [Campylobacterales bacterium]|nr:sel1 repeat family protein [Campylobacterales bacterium]